MMSDAVLQILLILAYLAIGLIAITFPIYAICVTFLPQERWESEKERKNRIEKLRAKISELTSELEGEQRDSERVTQIREQLRRYENELKGTELRVDCLTAKGAVGTPVAYLVLGLLTVGIGIYSFSLEYLEGVVVFGFISSLCSALAVRRLYKTISAIEYAALRPARTVEFKVRFKNGENRKQIKLGEKSMLYIEGITNEQDVENFSMQLAFPKEFRIPETHGRDLWIAHLPDHTSVLCMDDFLPKNVSSGIRLAVTPEKAGEYAVPVSIYAKGIYKIKRKLIVSVVK